MKLIRTALIAIVLCVFVVLGFRWVLSEEETRADLILGFVNAVGLALICIVDSQIRGHRLAQSTHWLFVLCAPVAAPIYAVWSRGKWGFVVILVAVGLLVAATMVGGVIAFLLSPE